MSSLNPFLEHTYLGQTCAQKTFTCLRANARNEHQCIPESQRCDGTVQCQDSSDEQNCRKYKFPFLLIDFFNDGGGKMGPHLYFAKLFFFTHHYRATVYL